MRFIALVILVVSIIFAGSIFTSAAPAPTLFAYNDTTKQCGSFRDGDEKVRYDLPAPWQTYDYNKSSAKTVQQYCDELGYTNIGSVVDYLNLQPIKITGNNLNIGNNQSKSYNYVGLLLIATIAVALTTALFVAKSRNNK